MFEKSRDNKIIKKTNGLNLLRQFYHTYAKKNTPAHNESGELDKYHRKKTDSAEKVSKILNSLSTNPHHFKTISNSRKQSLKLAPVPLKRHSTIQSKRCYFRNQYCDSHPLLTTQHKISLKLDSQRDQYSQRMLTEQVQKGERQTVFKDFCRFVDSNNSPNSPAKNREMVMEIKQKMMKAKLTRKQKMQRVKYNYMVRNRYQSHIKEQKPEIFKSYENKYSSTQDRIFPGSNQHKIKTESNAAF